MPLTLKSEVRPFQHLSGNRQAGQGHGEVLELRFTHPFSKYHGALALSHMQSWALGTVMMKIPIWKLLPESYSQAPPGPAAAAAAESPGCSQIPPHPIPRPSVSASTLKQELPGGLKCPSKWEKGLDNKTSKTNCHMTGNSQTSAPGAAQAKLMRGRGGWGAFLKGSSRAHFKRLGVLEP